MKVSSVVSEILSSMHQLSFIVGYGLLNYSALSRLIRPAVEKKVGKPVKLHAIIVACKRFLAKSSVVGGGRLGILLKSCKLSLDSDVVEVHVRYSMDGFTKFFDTLKRLDWREGEKVLVVARANGASMVVKRKYLEEILACFKASDVVSLSKHRSIITLSYPQENFSESFGGLHFWSGCFDSLGVGILQVFSSHGRTSFLVNEEDAPNVVSALTRAFNQVAK